MQAMTERIQERDDLIKTLRKEIDREKITSSGLQARFQESEANLQEIHQAIGFQEIHANEWVIQQKIVCT